MQEYRNALNRQQSSQLAKIQQRQQQQIQQQQEETQKQQAKIEQQQQLQQIQQQQEIERIQQQHEQIQKQQIKIQQGQMNSKAFCYYTSDITQLYAERHWSEQLVNDDSVFLFVLSAQGDILYCSDSCQGLTGYSVLDVIGHTISEFLHPDDLPHFYALLDQVFETPLRLSQIDFRWKMKSPATGFASMQCFGYSKPDDVPSFTLSQSNHLESNYYAFFALAQVREPTTADVLTQLKRENQRLQQQLAYFVGSTASTTLPSNQPSAPLSSSVIASWMQSDTASSIPWVSPQHANASTSHYFVNRKTHTKTNMVDDPVPLPIHEKDSHTIKSIKANPVTEDNAKKKKKVYITMEEHQCSDCGSTNSPEWRKGPLGRKTLCNACGLRWAKKNKKINLD